MLVVDFHLLCVVFFFKQKTAYEMRISDWSSDVCSSDLPLSSGSGRLPPRMFTWIAGIMSFGIASVLSRSVRNATKASSPTPSLTWTLVSRWTPTVVRSEEHTSELQSLMRNSYAVFRLKQKTNTTPHIYPHDSTPTP